jgi:hypothetical protein
MNVGRLSGREKCGDQGGSVADYDHGQNIEPRHAEAYISSQYVAHLVGEIERQGKA